MVNPAALKVFGLGFWPFSARVQMVFGTFPSKATACVLVFEAFRSGVLRPDFATVLQRGLEDLTMGF